MVVMRNSKIVSFSSGKRQDLLVLEDNPSRAGEPRSKSIPDSARSHLKVHRVTANASHGAVCMKDRGGFVCALGISSRAADGDLLSRAR